MSTLYLTFDQFTKCAHESPTAKVQMGRGIVVPGPHANSPKRRFNARWLRRFECHEVRYFIEEMPDGLPAHAVIFDLDGIYLGLAKERRAYYPELTAFINALDFEPEAFRRLNRIPGWDGIPWHVHLAATQMSIMTDAEGQHLLPWNTEATR